MNWPATRAESASSIASSAMDITGQPNRSASVTIVVTAILRFAADLLSPTASTVVEVKQKTSMPGGVVVAPTGDAAYAFTAAVGDEQIHMIRETWRRAGLISAVR